MMYKNILPLFFLLSLLLFAGCGETKVSGKVLLSDGTPLTNGNVLFENDLYTYSAKIHQDGSFDMGMLKDGEGIPAGQYRVAVISLVPGDEVKAKPRLMTDKKYASSNTSGITYDIQANTTNIEIVVEKAAEK